ncbi:MULTISPECIES: ABC transporter permease [Niallia]|uniref:ABC transporter permease n=2 Tax=Niallia TaxID=2837506 RepID=A0A3S2U812_9BACI|nr:MULTISPECIES: ABC transporter permease [Niallia]MCM3217415.1 ABC transporter permease [Niallia taxi]MCT2343704.1 ABC transporter permease [Niallia taxi]MDE5055592.1 ABC transporter permease [Niallia taxi]MDK8641390.1 ABC transporter permease [Niallia taxi]MED3965333.1 ABC transporter permease [Niallia taxi]
MLQYIIRRVLIAIPVLFGVTIFNFFIINMAPGNPVDMYLNPDATEADAEAKKEALGLNDPIYVQYIRWLGNLLHGDFGFSYTTYEPVLDLIMNRVGPTLLLMGAALVIAYIIAIPIGILSASKQYSWIDYLTTTFSFLGVSIPSFFLGLGAIYLFSLVLGILPTGGMFTLGSTGGFMDTFIHLLLPAAILGTGIAGSTVRYVRSSMLEVLGQDYLRTARAKGLKEFVVTNKHALKNALIPIITIIGMEIPVLIGGAVVTEQIFQWPGLGQLTIQSISSRDYPTLMAINFLAAFAVLFSNLLTDILYSVVDPRIKYS